MIAARASHRCTVVGFGPVVLTIIAAQLMSPLAQPVKLYWRAARALYEQASLTEAMEVS
jgi:hypothetical protein